jgi:hypothetical protein
MTKVAIHGVVREERPALAYRSRAFGVRVAPNRRRSPVAFVLLAAVLALTTVGVAERIENRLIETLIADTPVADLANDVSSAVPESALESAVLPSGAMALTLRNGAATVTTGADASAIELATSTIGDLDLGALAADVVIAQADDEVSYDWGDVTEWYRTVPEGIEHGYTVDAPLSESDELTVTVTVADGTPTLVDADTVAIERREGGILWYQGLFAFDATGTDLPAEMAVVGGDIELRVDTTGAEYPITIDPTITEAQRLVPVPDAAGDRFGESVAIDGVPGDMTVVVGALGDDDRGENQGTAYVFHNDGSGWAQQAKLFPSTLGNRQFGWDVDVRGDVIVVGAPGDDENGNNAGAVYVFEPTGPSAQWQQTSVVYQCDPSIVGPCGETAAGTGFENAGFGFAVDLTDQFLLVGAPRFQDAAGGAWVYQRAGSDWLTSTAGVIARTDSPADGDQFGYAVAGADAGAHIVVGAPGVDAFAVDTGRTYYFRWDGAALSAPLALTSGNVADGNTGDSVDVEVDAQGDVWMFSGAPVNTRFEDGTQPGVSYAWRHVLPAGLDPVTDNLLDYGSSAFTPARAAFTGAHALFADPLADGAAPDAGSAGHFTVLPDEPPAFNILGLGFGVSLPANAGDNWGFDVAAAGDTYVIGGPGNDTAGIDAGEVRIGSFTSVGSLEVLSPDVDVASGRLGYAVDIDGNRMVASAPFADVGAVGGAGAVSVYERADDASPWGLVATIPSPTPEAAGGFGDAVALRGDVVVVGESDRLGGSDEPGRVFVFQRDAGGNWVQLNTPIVSGALDVDAFGASLDIFAVEPVVDVVIGSPGFDGRGAVFRAVENGGAWNVQTVDQGDELGDEFGYSVALPPPFSGSSDSWLAVGAPGVEGYALPGPPAVGPEGGAIDVYVFTGNGPSGFEFRTGFSGYLTGSRIGTAVDVFGNRVVVGGYGDGTNTTLQFNVVEFVDPELDGTGFWDADVVRSAGIGFDVGDGLVNDYLAIEGGVIAIGVPGGGGQVALFQFDGLEWSDDPVDVVQPSGREAGDRIGRALALDGRTLITGAPGDDGEGNATADAGAAYSVLVPMVATSRLDITEFGDPVEFWDVGVIPGPNDHAIVSGAPSADPLPIFDPTTYGRLTVFGTVLVDGQLEVLGSTRIDGGVVDVSNDAEFRVGTDVDLHNGGTLITAPLEIDVAGPGRLTVDGEASISGTGQISNLGEVVKIGTGTLGVGPAVTWYSEESSTIDVQGGSVLLAGGPIETVDGVAGFPGALRLAAGTTFDVQGDLVLEETTVIESEINGPSDDVANYGRVRVDVDVTKAGLLASDLVGYSPGLADSYPVITCAGDCYPGRFDVLSTAPFDVATTQNAVTLQLVDGKLVGPDDAVERFGFDVDIDGVWAVVGAPEPFGDTYVYELVDGDWTFRQALGFAASSVAIQGNVIAAGGYLYERPDGESPFAVAVTIGGDAFDIDGDLLIIGELGTFQSVRVRSLSGGTEVELDPPPGPLDPSFGAAVAIVDLGGGDAYAAVGAPEELGGRVHTYKRSGGTWNDTPDETLSSPDLGAVPDVPAEEPRGQFGNAVAIDGSTLVIGERLNSAGIDRRDAGAAWVYEGEPGNFQSPVELQASDADGANVFGSDVAVDGDVIIVGAGAGSRQGVPFRDGTAYLFDRSGASWIEREALRAPDGANQERFGDAVAISGDNVIVGAPEDINSNGPRAGAIYAFGIEPPEPPADPFAVTTTADAGPGSLRAALVAANAVSVIANPNPIVITFEVPGPGPHTISPSSPLPLIVRPVLIDGFSQPGSAPNTAAIDEAINAVIRIELSGALVPGASVTGLDLRSGSSGSTIRGLSINRFSGRAIGIFGAGGQTITGNYIGVGPDGSAVVPGQQEGLQVGTSANTIGGDAPGDRNVISGHSGNGVTINSSANVILGNFIGTDPTGTAARPNGIAGVVLSGPENVVGGVVAAHRNLVSGNGQFGVRVRIAAGNVIQGNRIGTDLTGTLPLPNGTGLGGDAGVLVQQGATGTLIGGTNAGAGNLIASNNPFGVHVSGATTSGTSILGNRITGNTGLGINITDQVLPVPVITSLVFDGVELEVSGTVAGAADDYRIELFANDDCDASGFGEGQYVLGSIEISSADFADGTAGFSTVIAAPAQRFNVTATATNSAGSTSTFAACVDSTTSVPIVPPTGLSVDISASTPSTEVGVAAIDIASLPASVFQGYGGPTADYARSDLQTIDLRTDTIESTPVADVTLADLELDSAPVTRNLLRTILLSDIPITGGWSAKLRPNGPPIVEQTITLLDVHDADRFPGVLDDIRLGDLGLRASNLGSISTYAALLAGVPVTQLPVPASATEATAFWCDLVERNGLDCATDFGPAPLTLPALSFAGVDVEQAEFLGALIDGETDLVGTPIGSTLLGALNIGAVPLASQPLVPSKSLPSYLPSTVVVPDRFRDVTLGELDQAAPLGALTPEDVGLESGARVSVLDIEHQPDSPLADYSWVAPAAGASLLVSSEAELAPRVAGIPLGDLGLNAPVLSVPLDEIILPNGRNLGEYRLVELLGGEAEFGAAPFAASPFAASPFGSAPFAASSIGASPFRASPFRASPFRASPFRASPFAASPFRASEIGSTPFRASPFRASPFRASPFAASTFGVSPFRASPFRASPFRASPFAASPFRASEFGVSPFGASPFRASPFRASPFDTSPFRASPFRASPLSELGLSAPVTAIPLDGLVGDQSLGSYRLADLDPSNLLFGLPLEPFVGWVDEDGNPVFDCDVIDCRQPNGFTLGEGIEAGALPTDLTIDDVQPGLFGLRLSDLVGAHPAFTTENLRAFSAAITLTLGEAADAGFAPDGIPIELFSVYDQVTIRDERLVFSGWRLVDFAGLAEGLDLEDLEAAFAAWASANPLTVGDLTQKIPVAKDGLGDGELWVDTLAVSTLVDAAPDLTVGDIWPLLRPLRVEHLRTANGQQLSVTPAAGATTIGSILDDDPDDPQPSRLEGLLWGDIVGSAGTPPLPSASAFTVADVISGFTGVTLGEFLRAAQPITDQRTEEIDLSAIDLADYATGTTVSFDVDVRVTGGNRPQSARIVVNLPDGARYVPGSAELEGFELEEDELAELEPATFGSSLVWQIANLLPDTTYKLRFDTRSSERLGTLATAASAQLASVDLFAVDSTAVEYREALEPNDTPVQADGKDPILTDQIVLSQISSATDVDIFSFQVTEAGQRIGGVLWNLPADYDLTIIGPGTEPLAPTEGRIRESVDDLDSPILGGATSSTLSDGGQYQPPPEWSVIARSTSRGTAPETIAPVPTYVTGTYYLVVSSYNGAFSDSPYALRLLSNAPVVAPPVCPAPTDFPFGPGSAPPLGPLPNDVNTLFVVNHDRLARQYGDTQADQVLAEIDGLTAALGGDTLSDLGLVAGTIDLGRGNDALDSAYSRWDDTPCDLALANGVVRETIKVLRGVYAANPDIENVVLVGSDRVIPFARIADRTLIGNEQSYAGTFSGDTSSPLYAALQAGTYFSDDPFVDPTPTLVNDRALYVAEKSVGRLVEHPDEIIGQLESFVDQGGTIRVDSAVVSGYDFLADSSEQIADFLEGPVTGLVDGDLIREDWTAPELAAKIFPEGGGTSPGIGVINGHFSHQGTQSAFGSATGDEDDALFVEAIGDSDFTGSLLFTVGCHSGLSADEFIPGPLGASWAESLAAAGASAYIAQSGFGYGSTDSIQLTERLLSVFASRLDGNFTIGEALRFAKNQYVAPLSAISVYDEKSLQQAILYGLPFSRPDVAAPPERPGPPPLLQLVEGDIPGLRTATLTPTFDIERADRPRGTVFEIDGQSYAPSGKPLQPIVSVDATGSTSGGAAPERLHGSLLLGGFAYTVEGGPIDPVYNTPTVNRGEVEPEIQPIDAIYPISPLGVSDAVTEFGRREFVTIQPSRFTATRPDGTGDQVLYDSLSIQTLHSASDDWVAPTVTSVNQTVVDGALSVTASTPDSDVAGVVVAVVENLATARVETPARWRTFALADAGDGRWSGGINLLSSCTEQLEYLVQIYDRAGNVRVMSNKAAGFVSSCAGEEPPPQDPALLATPSFTNLDSSGWFVGPVTVDIDSALAGPFSYRLDGGPPVVIPAGTMSFEITGNGIRTFEVRAAGNSLTAMGVVRIDSGGSAPSISITSPSGDVVVGATSTVAFSCVDPSLVSCAGALTDPSGVSQPVTSGQQFTAVAGTYTLTVTADDAISTTVPSVATRSFTAVRTDTSPPTITCPSATAYLLNRAGATMTVTVTDAESGPTVPTITLPVPTGTVGPGSIEFTATDLAGNDAVETCDYTVGYQFVGFQPPLRGTAVNQVRAGSNVPVKWRITDANGAGVADPASFAGLSLVQSPCAAAAAVNFVGELDITDVSALRYLGNGTWQQNWKASKTLRGCFDLQLRLADTSTPRVAELRLR